ncbi:MAG: EAL domain-containing protein [Chloroflexi bacterium]|nr:MAG: EAL domain-containing protein [Chloroflexota bacterium]
MTEVAEFLSHVVGVAFSALGVAATVGWMRHRGRTRAWLATALGLLGLVSLVGELPELVGITVPAATAVSVIGFTGSGMALVELRHALVPLRCAAHCRVVAAVVVVTATALVVHLPHGSGAHYSPLQIGVVLALILLWAGCVSEPAITFWRAAQNRPQVQRARLRALSAGYLGLVAGLLVAMAAGSVGAASGRTISPALAIPIDLVFLAMVPVLYAGFAPPRWLRRLWRAHEEDAYRRGVQALLVFSADEATLSARALEWATRLVGAEAGVLRTPSGRLVATPGMSDADAEELAATATPPFTSGAADTAHGERLVASLPGEDGEGVLVLVAGPFSPFLGGDEARRLGLYATSLTAALERVRTVEALAHQTARMEMLLEAVSDLGQGLLVTEAGRMVYANDAYIEMTGYTREELQGRNLVELAPEELREELAARLRSRLAGGDAPMHYIVRDITERKRAEIRLAAAARLDPLTGVANRRVWEEELQRALSRARRDRKPLSVAILDLDNFKGFNDDWGHPRGDRLLRDVATAWSHALRDVDFLARYGGDEFAVVMPGCAGLDARAVLQRLREATPERQQTSGGVAEWDGKESADELVGRADAALFEAKRAHRGSIAIAAAGAGGDRFTGWSSHIGRLLDEQRLRAAYQPICRLADGTVFAYEALARPDATEANASVEELFAAAHRLGLTRDLDWLSRKVAVRDARHLPDGPLLFVNVSASALLDPVHDVDQMLLLLATTGRRPGGVVLEISEREAISDLRRLREVLACYRREGFRFALDDVGEGHSTLEVLVAAEAEYIKLAASLTRRIDGDRPDAAIRAITTFAASTGASLVAEGVENPEAPAALRRAGIGLGQGFALGLPAFPCALTRLPAA